jgi:hypothetical protein
MIVDRDGAEIGVCTQIWTDDRTGRGEWAAARMGGSSLLVPLMDADDDRDDAGHDRIRVVVRRDEVMLAPAVSDRHHLTEDDETRLYRHFGIGIGIGSEPDGRPVGEARTMRLWAGSAADDPVTAAAVAVTALAVFGVVVLVIRQFRSRWRGSARSSTT